MATRMPSLRRPARPAATSEDSADNDAAARKRSQLPQLTPRSARTTSDVSSSTIPISSPVRPNLGIATKPKDDKAAMPPPSAPPSRTQSVRTRSIPHPPSATTSVARSGIAAPTRALSTRAPAATPSSSTIAQRPRVLSHSRTPSASLISAPTTADATLKRSSTLSSIGHVRSRSSTTTATKPKSAVPTTPTAEKPSTDPVKPPVRRIARSGTTSALPALDATRPRPAFNTLQQHYSPAKTTLPKPPVPSSRVAPSAEEKAVQSGAVFETTKLQSELLYLSLLHESAEPNLRSYEKSARRALEKEFEAAQVEIRQMREQERLVQEQGNLAAISEWLGIAKGKHAHISQEAAETIQCLSGCLNELMMLSAPESKYSTLVHSFSEWASEATEQDRAHVFSGPLPQDWHQLHASLSQRVRLVEREVEMLPPAAQSASEGQESSLAIVLQCLNGLVTGMKEELEAMVRLERQVVATEKQRVASAVAGLSLDTVVQESEKWTPAW